MKTTVELPDTLLAQARELAARRGTTVRALIEEGLRRVVGEKARRRPGFVLRDASFGSGGLTEEAQAARERIRHHPYRGRGT